MKSLPASSASSAFIVALAIVFLALHLPFLPRSLEDLDSINFALGVRHFDVAHHQPHPPGYPVYIALAKGAHALAPDEARALGALSIVAGALGVLAIGALFRRLDAVAPRGQVGDGHPSDRTVGWIAGATAVAVTSPLYYFTAARPLSDASGLTAAMAIQALTLTATTTGTLAAAAFAAGLATGIRSQVAWLTVPLIIWRLIAGFWFLDEQRQRREARNEEPATSNQGPATSNQLSAVAAAFCAGTMLWAVPLVILSGGIVPYWHALFNQGAEDLGNIQMLWSHHGARDIVDAMYYALVAPWAAWWVAAFVLAASAVGVRQLWMRQPRALVWLTIAFGPYFVFDVLFQETFTGRYALPLVIPIAFLAVAGLRRLPREAAVLLTLTLAMYDAHIGGTSVAAYASRKAPAFRLLDDMRVAAAAESVPPVLAPDRRESLDLRGPFKWLGGASPRLDRQLPAPPQHEWLEAVNYWNAGGRAPVWFVVDPMRASVDLVQHRGPATYRWSLPYPVLLSGVRPNEMDWYRVDRPEWYVGEGWPLTPEAAGVAAADHRGLSVGGIDARVRRLPQGGSLMIGGRNTGRDPQPLRVALDGARVLDESIAPGSFLRFSTIAANGARDAADYAMVSVTSAPNSTLLIEQFGAATTAFGYGGGWHEPEFNPRTGERWRWLSERGELQLAPNAGRNPMRLLLQGDAPRRLFSKAQHLKVRLGDRVIFDAGVSSNFELAIPIPATAGPIVLETDRVGIPADSRWRRSADRRHLGLRIVRCEIRPA